MASQRGERPAGLRDLIQLGVVAPQRMTLESKPPSETVYSFFFTRAAKRAWSIYNSASTPASGAGAFFWIGGMSGTGKTHFLNYICALDRNAGAVIAEDGRRVTLTLEINTPAKVARLEALILQAFANVLGGGRSRTLWREIEGEGALETALDQAARVGVRAITLALDFGPADVADGHLFLARLAAIAERSSQPALVVIVASRQKSPAYGIGLDTAPADLSEQVLTAIGRSRRLAERAGASILDLYADSEIEEVQALAIFPFHPTALASLGSAVTPNHEVHELGNQVLEVLQFAVGRNLHRLIYGCDLFEGPRFSKIVESRLGESGRTALRKARALLSSMESRSKLIGQRILETLVLDYFCGVHSMLKMDELGARMPPMPVELDSKNSASVRQIVEQLAADPRCGIRLQDETVRFDPVIEGTEQIAAFNLCLPLAKAFDPTLSSANELSELVAKTRRLNMAMAGALESACRIRDAFTKFALEQQVEIPPRQQSAIDRFVELASIGAAGILSQSEQEHRRSLHIVTEFESIGRAATAIPQITQMRKYLDATDLDAAEALVPARIDSARTLATERELLKAQLRPENLFAGANAMESLRERFQKFKWSFAQFFRAAHSQRQREISELSILADQTTKYLDALRRLDGIPQLGPPQSSRFELPFSGLLGQLVGCESTDALAAEIDPRCNSCGFAIGSASPRAALIENSTQIRDALSQKLAKLSQKAIARLIREHDTERRLEGFLKITQAAQADALSNLIDDELVAYLSEMLKHWTLERSVSAEKKLHAGTTEKVAMVPGRFPKAITKRRES